jgi:outer membrane protein assembly factor BamB
MKVKILMTKKMNNLAVVVTTLLLSACSVPELDITKAETADKEMMQWPMFAGPVANEQVQVALDTPLQWSVRNDHNIKWHAELPAGGQSGIAVWGDNVFLTINQPLDTPKFSVLNTDFTIAKVRYQSLYNATLNTLQRTNDATLKVNQAAINAAEQQWQMLLAGDERLQQAQKKKRKHVINKLKRETPFWRAIGTANKRYTDYVNHQSVELTQRAERYDAANKLIKQKGLGKAIVVYCLSAADGTIKWSKTLTGRVDTMYNYAFSDATSPTPITDGKQVWVINAAGAMASYDMQGNELWSRTWQPTEGRPFNKQYEPLLSGDYLFNVEPPLRNDKSRQASWNYLHAINKVTGVADWVSKDALTHYNTPMLGKTPQGKPAIMIGRGGPHGVPETPLGLSLIDISGEQQGQSIWQWQVEDDGLVPWGATDIQLWNEKTTLWFAGNRELMLYQIDTATGKTVKNHDLTTMNRYVYNEQSQQHDLVENMTDSHFERQPYTPILIGDAVYFLVRYEPYIAYVNLITGEHSQLEIPTEVNRSIGKSDQFIWKTMQKTDQLNAKGQRHNIETRSQGDGTQKAFLASPMVVNGKLYFTNAHGLTYVIDTNKPFGPDALVAVNDIGDKGKTYSLSSMAHANGTFFQRSLKGVYAINAQ